VTVLVFPQVRRRAVVVGDCRVHDRFVEQNNEATAAAATVADGDARAALLADLLGQVAGCFPRRETRQTCARMVNGLLMELEDQNCWTIAEAIGDGKPYRLHHFLSRAAWDEELLADTAACWAADRLDDGDGLLIIDETGDAKSSADAAGAARQYSGSTGGVALCQVMVTLTYATSRGHTLLGRALYLPDARAADEEHRELTGIPDEVMFETKPQLAGGLAEHALELGIEATMVAGDEVYGGRELRRLIRGLGLGYVLAVRSDHRIVLGSGKAMSVAAAAAVIPARAWQRMPTGSGTKGIRDYDWAMIEITGDDSPDDQDKGNSALLVRRHRYTRKLSYYRCWTPEPAPLSRLIHVATARWRIEEDHQLAKQTCGLDKGQVTCWNSWHRWTAMCVLAYIFLTVAAALERRRDGAANAAAELIDITVPELLRLLRGTVIPPPRRDREHVLDWSHWRRQHQYRARQAHQRLRLRRHRRLTTKYSCRISAGRRSSTLQRLTVRRS
jgi:SRSO17 transposase